MPDLVELGYSSMSDIHLAQLYSRRDPEAVRLVMTRNNQRLFRAAYSILGSRSEAEDIVQNVYLKAFSSITTFEGRSSISTWLTRVTVNEALEQRRTNQRRKENFESDSVIALQEQRDANISGTASYYEPDRAAAREQLRKLIEDAIDRLPDHFRLTFLLREVEQLRVAEIAEVLDVPVATVKTRCLRARRLLQEQLLSEVGSALNGSFPFAGAECEAMAEKVLNILAERDVLSSANS